jgi:AbrB family looped-hinge helix DNA binding protein
LTLTPRRHKFFIEKTEFTAMIVKITAKRQITLPARVLDALGLRASDRLELRKGASGFILRACSINRVRLAPLRGKLRKGRGTFDLESFRDYPRDPAQRV